MRGSRGTGLEGRAVDRPGGSFMVLAKQGSGIDTITLDPSTVHQRMN